MRKIKSSERQLGELEVTRCSSDVARSSSSVFAKSFWSALALATVVYFSGKDINNPCSNFAMGQNLQSRPSELQLRAESAAQAFFNYIMTGDQLHWNTFNAIYGQGSYRDLPNTGHNEFNDRFFAHIATLRARERNPRFENLFQAYLADQPTANPRSHVEFIQWFNETREVMLRGNRGPNREAYERIQHRNQHLVDAINTFLHVEAARHAIENFFQYTATGDAEHAISLEGSLNLQSLNQSGFIGAAIEAFGHRLAQSGGIMNGYRNTAATETNPLSADVLALTDRCNGNRACEQAVQAGNPLEIAFLQYLSLSSESNAPAPNLRFFMRAVQTVFEAARSDCSAAHLDALRTQPTELTVEDQTVSLTLGANFVNPLLYLFARARGQRIADLLSIPEPTLAAAAAPQIAAIRHESFLGDAGLSSVFLNNFGTAFSEQVRSNPRFANIVYAYESTFLPSAIRDIFVSLGRSGEQDGIFGRGERSLLRVYGPELVNFVIQNYSALAPMMVRDDAGLAAQLAFFRQTVYPEVPLSRGLAELQAQARDPENPNRQQAMAAFLEAVAASSRESVSGSAAGGRAAERRTTGPTPSRTADSDARLFFDQLYAGLEVLSGLRPGESREHLLGVIYAGVSEVRMLREAARANLRGHLAAFDLISENVGVLNTSRELFDFLRNEQGEDVIPTQAQQNSRFAAFLSAARAAPADSILRRVLITLNLQQVDPRQAGSANVADERGRFLAFCGAYTNLLRSDARRTSLEANYTTSFVNLISDNMGRLEWVVRPVQGPDTESRPGERPASPRDGLDAMMRTSAFDTVMARLTHPISGGGQERYYTMPALAHALHDAYTRLFADPQNADTLAAITREYGPTLSAFVHQNLSRLAWLGGRDVTDASIEAALPARLYSDQYAAGTSLSNLLPSWDPFVNFGSALRVLRSTSVDDPNYPMLVEQFGRGFVSTAEGIPSASAQRTLRGAPDEQARFVQNCESLINNLRALSRSVARMREEESGSLGPRFLTDLDPLLVRWIAEAEALARDNGSLATLQVRYERLNSLVFTEEDLDNAVTLARSGASLLMTGSELNMDRMAGGAVGGTMLGPASTGTTIPGVLPSTTTPPTMAGGSLGSIPLLSTPRRFGDLIQHYREIPSEAVERRRLFAQVVQATISAQDAGLYTFINSFDSATRTQTDRASSQDVFMRELAFTSFQAVYTVLSNRPVGPTTADARAEYEASLRSFRETYGDAFVNYVQQGLGTRTVASAAGQFTYSGPLALLTESGATAATLDALPLSVRTRLLESLRPTLGDLANRGPLLGALRDVYMTLSHPATESAGATASTPNPQEARVSALRVRYGDAFVDLVLDQFNRAEIRRALGSESGRVPASIVALRSRYGSARVDSVIAEADLQAEQRAQIIADPLSFLSGRVSLNDLTSLDQALLTQLNAAFDASRSGAAGAQRISATQGTEFMDNLLVMTERFPEVYFALRNSLNMQSAYSADRHRMLENLRLSVRRYESVFGTNYYLFDQFINLRIFTENLRRLVSDANFDTSGCPETVLRKIRAGGTGNLRPQELIDFLASPAGDRLIAFGRDTLNSFVGTYLAGQQTDANAALSGAIGLQAQVARDTTSLASARRAFTNAESSYNSTRNLPSNDPVRVAADADYAASRAALANSQAAYDSSTSRMQGLTNPATSLDLTRPNTSAMLALTGNLSLVEMTYFGSALQGAGLSAFDRRAAESLVTTLNAVRQRDPILAQYFLGLAVPAILRVCTDSDAMVGAFDFIRSTVEGAYSQDATMLGAVMGPRASMIAFFNTLSRTADAVATSSSDYHEQWDQLMATRLPGSVESVPGAQQFRLRTPGPLFQPRTRAATLMAGQLRPMFQELFPDRWRFARTDVFLPLTQNPSGATDPLVIVSGARPAPAEAERSLNLIPFTVPLGDIPASMNITGMRSSAVLAWLARVRGATMQRPRYSNRSLRTFAEAALGSNLQGNPSRLLGGASGLQITPTGGWRGLASYSRYNDEVAAQYEPPITRNGLPSPAVAVAGSSNTTQQFDLNYSAAGVNQIFPVQRTTAVVQYRAAEAQTIAPQTGDRVTVSSSNDWYATLNSRFRPFGADGAVIFVGRGSGAETPGTTREDLNWRSGLYIILPNGDLLHIQGGQQHLLSQAAGQTTAGQNVADPLLNYLFGHSEVTLGSVRTGAALRFLGLGDSAGLANLDGGIIGMTVPTGGDGSTLSATFLANVARYMNSAAAQGTAQTYTDAQGNTHRVFNMDPRALETGVSLSYAAMLRDSAHRPERQMTFTATWRQSAAMERPTGAGAEIAPSVTRQEYQNIELRVRSVARDPHGTSWEALFGTTFGGNFESFGGMYGTARWISHADRYRTSGWRFDAQYANVDVGREFVSNLANFENNFRNMELFYLNVEHYTRDRARNTAFWAAANMTYAQMSNYVPSATNPQAAPESNQVYFNIAMMYMVRRHRIMVAGGRDMPFLESSQYIDETVRRIQTQDPTRMQQGYQNLGTFLQNALRSEIWRGAIGWAFDGEHVRVSFVGGIEARPDPIRGQTTTAGGVTGLFLFGPTPTTQWFLQLDGRVFQAPSTVIQPTRNAAGLVTAVRPETASQRYASLYASVGVPGSTAGTTTSVNVPIIRPANAPSAQVMRVDGTNGLFELVRNHVQEIAEQAQDPQNSRRVVPGQFNVIADVNLHQQITAAGTGQLTLARAGSLYVRRQYNPPGTSPPMTLVIGNQADFDIWTEQRRRNQGGVPTDSAYYLGDGFVYTLNLSDGPAGSNQYLVNIGGVPAPPAGFGLRATVGISLPLESTPRTGGRPGMSAADVANSMTVGFMMRLCQTQTSRHFLGAMLANRRLEDDQLRQLRVTYLAERRLSSPGAAVQETLSYYLYFDYTDSTTGVLTVGTQEDYTRYLNSQRWGPGGGVSYVRLTPGAPGRPQDSREWTFEGFGYIGHERTSSPLMAGAGGTLNAGGYEAVSHGGRVFWGVGLGIQQTQGRGTSSARTWGVSVSAGGGTPQYGVNIADEQRAVQFIAPYALGATSGTMNYPTWILFNARVSW